MKRSINLSLAIFFLLLSFAPPTFRPPPLKSLLGRFCCQNLSAASQEKSRAAPSELKDVNMPAVAVPDGGEVS